ncbi:MAG: VWA domain-containing protein [Prevotella sp.]|nr:VWA domain-containing protein [Prevotella sp.]
MFRFEDPIYLYGLVAVVVLALIRFVTYRKQKSRLRKFGDPQLLKALMPDVSRFRPVVKFWLLEGALALLFVVLARPQMGTRISHEKRTGIETIIAIDISNSMRAQDVEPSRLDRAKMMVENLVDNFTNDKIGLIVFAGDAFVQLPITSDYVSAKMFLSSIDPSMMQNQGTDVAAAIEMATHSFTQQENIGKAIIVITDGEDHEGGALEAAKAAREKGMRVYVLGVGSTKGSPVPVPGTGDYMRDNAGNTVMSALNEQMCSEIAQAGGGAYIHVENNSGAQRQLDEELDKLEKNETESTIYSDYDEQFQAVALIALLLLIIEIVILECKNPLLRRVSLFKRTVSLSFIICLLSFSPAGAQTDRQLVRQGNRLFQKGDYEHAEVAYSKAVEKNDKNTQAHYNLGAALMAQKKDSAAVVEFEKAGQQETVPMRKAQSYHNMGVLCQRNQLYGEAIEAYKQSLRLNPADDETRYNLVLCQQQKKKQDEQKQQQQEQQQQQQKQEQQQQKQDQQKEEQQQPQEQKQQMSKENAEQLLKAAMQQEKQTQKRMKEAQQKAGQRRQNEKNW